MEARDIILRPVITEASMAGMDNKRYTFVEEIFDVKVVKVNIMNLKGKKKRQGRYVGYTKRRRKTIVTLSADSKEIKLFGDDNE